MLAIISVISPSKHTEAVGLGENLRGLGSIFLRPSRESELFASPSVRRLHG